MFNVRALIQPAVAKGTSNSPMTKAEVLRQAQLAMIRHSGKAAAS